MNKTTHILCFFVAAVISSSSVSAEYYRWKDNSGGTQYGDQIPTEEVNNGRVKVDESGRVVEEVAPARTLEEQKKFDEEQRLASIEQQRKDDQEAYDSALLATFNSAEEIMGVRDERLGLIEQSLILSRSRLHKQEDELTKLNDSRNRFIDRDMEPPEWISHNEKKVLTRIEGIQSYISERTLEKEKLRRQFGEDLQRFQELTNRSVSVR